MQSAYLAIAAAIFALSSNAVGAIEIGASGTYRRSSIAQNSYDEAKSISASASYYMSEASAFELSYTDATAKRYFASTTAGNQTTTFNTQMLGLDFVYTLGDSGAVLRPYAKIGAAYLPKKQIVEQTAGQASQSVQDPPSFVPSGGVGLRLALTAKFSIKLGIEAWGSVDGSGDLDYAGRAGIAWLP